MAEAPRAPDPVRVASNRPDASPARAVNLSPATFYTPAPRGSGVVPGGLSLTAAEQSAIRNDTPGRVTVSEPGVVPSPGVPPAVADRVARRVSGLSISSSNDARRSSGPSPSVRELREEESDPVRCKVRPEDNRSKGGGGAKRRFVPWCK